MNTRAFLVLLLSIAWIWFCNHWHCCWIHQYCSVPEVVAVTPPAEVEEDPLIFSWSDKFPIRSSQYQDFEDELFADVSDDNMLEITGEYFADEATPEGYENMGLARADALRKLFASRIPGERIRIKSQLVDETEGVRNNGFTAASFEWLETEVDKPEVVKMSDKTVILFPFNSASKMIHPSIDSYLDELATELKTHGGTVHLTGHTDAIGTDDYNIKLGYKRTRKIRRLLINKGIRRAQIKMDSKGKSHPVASNSTEEGRSLNRRVEVRVE